MVQLQFLNYILQTKDPSLITLNNLNKEYFSDYSNEFSFIDNHYKKYGNVPDAESFLNVFNDFEIIKVNEKPSYLLEELFKDYKTRFLAKTFNDVRDLLMNGKVDEAMGVYQKASENIKTGISLECVDILKDTSRYDAYVEKLNNYNKYYIKTGFKELDRIIGGWDREEELATIIARTNQGKSWILLKTAAAALEQGLNVGIYSGEMSENKVGYRLDTLLSHLSNGGLTHGNASIQNDYKKYIDSLKTRFSGSFKVITPQMINGPAGVNALRAFIEKEKLDILFVDQHSLLEDDRKAKNPIEKAANISKDLKLLQVMKKIPIISVSQMNRTKNDSDTDLIDSTQIAQSDRIGQDSTCIIGISRDKKDNNILKLQLVKSRDSENGKILNYQVDFNRGVFTFIPDENSPITDDEENKYENRYNADYDTGENAF